MARHSADVLALQRAVGNRATRALIARELSPSDQVTFEKLLRQQLGLDETEEMPPPLANMFVNACKRLNTLEDARAWLAQRASLLAGYGKTSKSADTGTKEGWDRARTAKAEREAAQPSLAPWVAPDPLGACLHPVASMSEDWSEAEQNIPIVWTGGAASCVAVGLYLPGKAALCHIDPQKIGDANAPLPEWFVAKLREFNGAVMHLSSGQMVQFLKVLQTKISRLANLAFASVHTHSSTRLALNARNGEIRLAFNVDEVNSALNRG
jgi:hypothetical protein